MTPSCSFWMSVFLGKICITLPWKSRKHAPFRQAGGYPYESCYFHREAHQLEDKETRTQGLCQDSRGIEHIWGVALLCGLHRENTIKIFLIQSTVILARAVRDYRAVAVPVRFLSLNFTQRWRLYHSIFTRMCGPWPSRLASPSPQSMTHWSRVS